MIRLAILTCREISSEACNDDNLIVAFLKRQGITAIFEIWDDPNVEWQDYDCVLVRSTWDYTEKIEKFISFLNTLPSHTKLFNPKKVILNNYNKSYLFELEEKGFEIVPSIKRAETINSIEEAFQLFECQKLIMKPLIGAGASGIQIIEKNTDLKKESKNEILIQPFQDSISTDGEISLIFFNNQFSHAILKIPKKNDYRSQEEFGSSITSFTPDTSTINYAKSALSSISTDTLFARVDLLKNQDGQWRYIGEVELIEPALYLSFDEDSAERFAGAIVDRIKGE